MSLLGDVAGFLESRGTPSALIGGAALAVHGVARATLDADLLVADARVFEAGFWKRGPVASPPEIRRGEPGDPIEGLLRFELEEESLDVMSLRGAWAAPMLERRIWIELEGQRVPVVVAADLVLLKLVAGGPQDLHDTRLLLAGRPEIRPDVEARLSALPAEARAAWAGLGEARG